MASYSVAQAQDELPDLILRATRGEEVVLTTNGVAVATVTPVDAARKRRGDEAFERLHQLREAGPVMPMTSVELLNAMYEDDD